ncbi:hypothetical protein BGLT_05201 [Caballeronia glathei]|uniref:Uncharacterized protein n=1 Tax=Caballeronia glathei TaxID=60547 RepID=A0A069PPK9_9BURK|nr:hypothetical protein [Caballeronia glathei]KDR39216.1 hypothetical protein BG61_34290 [Caballeronia glathei]CDY76129.1 hypothetical protein BGLT_05201 [Caballeronia glathei]
MTGREQFEANYEERKLPLLSSVKESHWNTWQAAQEAILSAHGPAVMLTCLDNIAIMPALPEIVK